MTTESAADVLRLWREPECVAARGTVLVVPGRGEHPGVYERWGRRVAAEGYRVRAVADPTAHEAGVTRRIASLLADDPGPRVLVGSDTGALFAAALVAEGAVPDVSALVLAGLTLPDAPLVARTWGAELDARTACPSHRRRLGADALLHRGAIHLPPPRAWRRRADPARIDVPVLGLHGADDAVAPLRGVRDWYAALPEAELVSLHGGRHDAVNDRNHRAVAATVVLFLERLRLGAETVEIVRAGALW